ncbi:MAG: glycosyltransferase family 25 protein [Helicobacteraceae bacterium]|nr:glycosyltransferase family 25 protein [Helicobacteraceae bacterium]
MARQSLLAHAQNAVKVYCITLQNCAERQKKITAQLNQLGLEFEFVYGIDGRALSQEEINSLYDREKCRRFHIRKYKKDVDLSRGEIGCTLSHNLLYKKMIDEDVQRAIILEDDALIDDDALSLLEPLSRLPIDGYVVNLSHPPSSQKRNKRRFELSIPWHTIILNDKFFIRHSFAHSTLTSGYYIDIKAARVMYKLTQRVFLIIDQWSYFREYVKFRIINRNVIRQDENLKSVIGGSRDGIKVKTGAIGHILWVIRRQFGKLRYIALSLIR